MSYTAPPFAPCPRAKGTCQPDPGKRGSSCAMKDLRRTRPSSKSKRKLVRKAQAPSSKAANDGLDQHTLGALRTLGAPLEA